MSNTILAATTMKAIEIGAKLLAHSCIKAANPEAEWATVFTDGAVEFATGSLLERLFSNNNKMQKKLNRAIHNAFEEANNDFDDRFSDFQQYFIENNLIFKMNTKEDFRDQIRAWSVDNKKSITNITPAETEQFAESVYQELERRIQKNGELKMYLAPQRVEEAAKVLLEEIPKLQQAQQNFPAAQQVDPELFKMTEEYLKKQIETLNAAGENLLEVEGDHNNVWNNSQKGGNKNTMRIKGNNNTFVGNSQG